jgi:hypothetical protein
MPRVPARHEFRIRSSQIQGVRPELEPRLPIRARSPCLRAPIRKPSCLISCSHSSSQEVEALLWGDTAGRSRLAGY